MVTKGSKQEIIKLNIRLTSDLHKKLKAKAAREDRSLNAHAVQIFKDALSNHPKRRATDRKHQGSSR